MAERNESISHSSSSVIFVAYHQSVGPIATLSELAKKVERREHVISNQTMEMEKERLIKRIKDMPKSRLLRLELTQKGLGIIKVSIGD